MKKSERKTEKTPSEKGKFIYLTLYHLGFWRGTPEIWPKKISILAH